MMIKTRSGNVARLRVLTSDTGAVVDVEWLDPPSRKDAKDVERFLRLGERAMSVRVEDDAKRADLIGKVLHSSGAAGAVQ